MRYHLCISVRGNLRKTDAQLKRDWKGCITDDAGNLLTTGLEIRNFWEDQLVQGREVIPAGDSKECDNFDFKKGCQGHSEEKQ